MSIGKGAVQEQSPLRQRDSDLHFRYIRCPAKARSNVSPHIGQVRSRTTHLRARPESSKSSSNSTTTRAPHFGPHNGLRRAVEPVGAAMQMRLARRGIATIGDLARIGEVQLVARYGKIGRRLYLCARGEDDCPVNPERDAKSMSSEVTLDKDVADREKLRPILWHLAETVSRRMKKE